MLEDEMRRVKERALEMGQHSKIARHAAMDAAVERIAHDRMADRTQVDANLVRPAGMNRHLCERQRRTEVLGADDARDRGAASPYPQRCGRHLLAVVGIAADWRVDAAAGHHLAPHQRQVLLFDFALVELARQFFVRRVVLGDHHQPRRAAVEPVHDAGTLFAADAAEIVDVVEQRVHQRAAACPAAGCTTMPAGLSTTIRSWS